MLLQTCASKLEVYFHALSHAARVSKSIPAERQVLDLVTLVHLEYFEIGST